jgi:hypothetical protein
MDDEDFFYVTITGVVLFFATILILGLTNMNFKDNETMAKLGYQQTPIVGSSSTVWTKVGESK